MKFSEFLEWAKETIGAADPDFRQLSPDVMRSTNFFASGRMDSIQLMNVLLQAEEDFGFQFSEQAFQDRRLQTVYGMFEVISELKAGSYKGE
jgi:acyl carrier protein